MELTEQQKQLVLNILSFADGEDMDEIIDRSTFKDYLTRSLIMDCTDMDLKYYVSERNEFINYLKEEKERKI
jgi:hypothetical protein